MEQILSRDLDGFEAKTYEDRRLGIEGVGPNHLPFVDMEPYLGIDETRFDELHAEVNLALAQIPQYGFPNVSGTIPEELRQFAGQTHPLNMLYELEKYDPTGYHRANLAKLDTKEQKVKYATFAMGAAQCWYFSTFLLHNEYLDRQDPTKVKLGQYAHLFRETNRFILRELPYKYVSRAILFSTFPGAELTCHRDFVGSDHGDHHICFNFGPGRQAYVYDCHSQQKVHVSGRGRAYMFNDRDYHGVSPVPYFTYTIRVDGQFEDELCEKLGLVDGRISGY